MLAARFDFAAHDDLMAAFPFAHELRFEATLTAAALTIATTVRATGDAAVPIAFGFHPYLRLPGVPRPDWRIEVPVHEQLRLGAHMLPTGERVDAEVHAGRLGDRTFDDAFRRAGRRRALRARRRRPAHRARVPRGLSLRAGLRARRRRRDRLRADDRPGQRARRRRRRAAALSSRGELPRDFAITLADGA